jgi:RNA polymerase sigma-70 factor (ECF subfamily)
MEHEERLGRLAAALDELPADQRLAVEMRHFDELPVADIARLMNRTVKSVSGLLGRGAGKLRQLLSEG